MPLLETIGSGAARAYGLLNNSKSSIFVDVNTLVYIPFNSDKNEYITNSLPAQDNNGGIVNYNGYTALRLQNQKTAYTASSIASNLAPLATTANWTIEYWLYKINIGGTLQTECELGSGSSYYVTGALMRPGDSYWRGSSIQSATGGRTYNQWNHVVWVGDNGTIRAYENGNQVSSGATTTTFGGAPEGFWLGGSQHTEPTGTGQTMDGAIRKFRVSKICRYPNGTAFNSSSLYPIGTI